MRWCESIWETSRAWRIGSRAKRLLFPGWSIMVNFMHRRIRNIGLTAMAMGAIWLWTRTQEHNLGSPTFSTGYLLLATVLFLALYNTRKKVPFLPLGNSATWLQCHIYAGIGSVGLFALHAGVP